MLCAKFGWNWPGPIVLEKNDFYISSMYFPYNYFVTISLWKRKEPRICSNWHPIHPKIICAIYLVGPAVLEKTISSMYFYYFIIIFPSKCTGPFIWTTLIPFTQKYFVPSLAEIGPVVLGMKIFNFRQCIFSISNSRTSFSSRFEVGFLFM